MSVFWAKTIRHSFFFSLSPLTVGEGTFGHFLHFAFYCSSKSAVRDSARARIPKVAEFRNGELLPAMIQRLVLMQQNWHFFSSISHFKNLFPHFSLMDPNVRTTCTHTVGMVLTGKGWREFRFRPHCRERSGPQKSRCRRHCPRHERLWTHPPSTAAMLSRCW